MLDVHFNDNLHGWVVGRKGPNALIVGTRDGGQTWETQYQGEEITFQFSRVQFSDSLNGWFCQMMPSCEQPMAANPGV